MRNLVVKIFALIMFSSVIIPLILVLLSEKYINYNGVVVSRSDMYELSRLPDNQRMEFVIERSTSKFLVNDMGMICDDKRAAIELANRFESASDLQQYCIQKGKNKAELKNKIKLDLINSDFFSCINAAANAYGPEIKELAKFRVQKKTGAYKMIDKNTVKSILHKNDDDNLAENYYQYLLKQEPVFFESNDFDEFSDISFKDLSSIEHSKDNQLHKYISYICNRSISEDNFDINNKFDLPYAVGSFLVSKLSTNNEILVLDCGSELCVVYVKRVRIPEDDLKNEVDLITQSVSDHLKKAFQNGVAITDINKEHIKNAQ